MTALQSHSTHEMDPHSTRSQFNHRVKRAGPPSRAIEHVRQAMPSSKKPSPATLSGPVLIRRPIATNSRIKQDEMVKRDMYLSFVTNALHQKSIGKSDTFDQLVAQFSPQSNSQIDTPQIRLWITALSHVVSRLERIHSSLVHAIVNMPWMSLDNATVKSYTIFIGSLLSARPEYLSLVLTGIARGFTYQSALQALSSTLPSTSTASPITRRTIYDRFHYLLRHILSLIPTLPSTLQPLLIRHFPHKRQNQVAQTTYIRNILRVGAYCPELSDRILATIVDRAIQIDVEIQIELEELEEMDDPEGDPDVPEVDPFDVVVGQEGSTLSDSDDSDDEDGGFSDLSSDDGDLGDSDDDRRKADLPTNVSHIQDMVKKLDGILLLVFEHLQQTRKAATTGFDGDKCIDERPISPVELPPLPPLEGINTPTNPLAAFPSNPPPLTPPIPTSAQPRPTSSPSPLTCTTSTAPRIAVRKLPLCAQFNTLLSIFDRTILRTFKSRYTQFLIFWYASLDPEFSDIFQGMLVDRALLGTGTQHQLSSGDERKLAHTNANPHLNIPELTRAAAASYIGSFVSRATFVDRDGARRVVGILCEYLRVHLEGVEEALKFDWSSSSKSNSTSMTSVLLAPGQHAVFYAVAQAVFLIFCFRWRDLVLDDLELEGIVGGDFASGMDMGMSPGMVPRGSTLALAAGATKDKWISDLGTLKRVVSCVLNPLKVCSLNVVMQFARVAHATGFVYCYPILDANRRAELSFAGPSTLNPSANPSPMAQRNRTASLTTPPILTAMSTTMLSPTLLGGEPVNSELNTFFPFDPYRLPKSNVFIQGVYREWAAVALDDDDDDEDDEEDQQDVDTSDSTERMGASNHLDIPLHRTRTGQSGGDDRGLGASLGAMSISPVSMR